MSINKLPDEIINQIAAGEVIENPSAVIKELIENSIDSGATQIDCDIEQSGLKKITITDNGCGIEKNDLLKAPLRHATSKIKEFDDLYNINTMGFRGEALASIFSVSKAKIVSQRENQAYEITSENTKEIKEAAGSKGTRIEVEDLFYNTPARKKYLKSENLELRDILDIFKRFELTNKNIKLTLKHNGKILINKPQFKLDEQNIIYSLGSDLKGKLKEINYNENGIQIKGFIANPAELTYSYKKNQYIFVNNRFIKSKIINDAIYDGFGSNLMVGRHPSYVLFISIDPEIIDVNVHPTKIEIRFENETQIYNSVKEAVKKIFQTQELFKEFEVKEDNRKLNEIVEDIVEVKKENKPLPRHKDYFSTESQKSFEVNDKKIEFKQSEVKVEPNQTTTLQSGPLYEELEDFRLLGQLDKTYIIIQTRGDMILVDQHVAEEKYFYESFIKQIEEKSAPTQKLLKGVILNFDNSEMCLYKENKEILDGIGFESEEYGQNEVIVRAVPLLFRHKTNDAQKLKELLHDIVINKSIKCVNNENHSKAASMACRMAVMAGDELTMPQMRRMVENLRYLKQPFNCPHGRPTFLKYSFKDLEKKFKRIV